MNENNELPCKEKLVFETKENAEATALSVDWQRGAKLKTYKCKHCKLWHLATK